MLDRRWPLSLHSNRPTLKLMMVNDYDDIASGTLRGIESLLAAFRFSLTIETRGVTWGETGWRNEASEDRRKRKGGKEGLEKGMCKLQKACDGCHNCCRQPWPLHRCFCSLSFAHPSLLCVFPKRGEQNVRGLSKPPLSVWDFNPPKPPYVRQSQSSYLQGPGGKPSYTGGEIFDLSSRRGSTVSQTTGAKR